MTQNRQVRFTRGLVVVLVLAGASCQSLSDAKGTAAIRMTEISAGEATGSPAAATTAEWVFVARNQAIYLRWSAPGGAVAGVIQTARRSTSGTGIKVTSSIIAGAANGPHFVLRTGRQTWSGTIDGDSLVLAVTRADGARDELRFVRGSVGDFDAAVAALRSVATTTTTKTTRRRSNRTATRNPTTTTAPKAPPPTAPDPAALLSDLDAARSRLRGLSSPDAAVGRVEAALDAMYRAADRVYAALGRPRCPAARNALARLDSTAAPVDQEVATIDQAAAQIENQRAVVMDVGLRVVALDDPGMNPAIVETNDELASADAAISELRRYADEVRAALTATTADAGRAVASQC